MASTHEAAETTMVSGVVRAWRHEEGWGVLDSAETPAVAYTSALTLWFDNTKQHDQGQD